jgi:hypothetical protein
VRTNGDHLVIQTDKDKTRSVYDEEFDYSPQICSMKHTAFKFLIALALCLSSVHGQTPYIVKNVTNGVSFYHMTHTLTVDDIRLEYPSEYYDKQWPQSSSDACKIGSNGHFNVFISKESFSILAPYCKSEWLKVTMNGRSNSNADIESKKVLWDQITEVKSGERQNVEIVLELNYADVVSGAPLTMILTQCNLSFRTANGAYIDNTESLR